jgi:hypothetical protein
VCFWRVFSVFNGSNARISIFGISKFRISHEFRRLQSCPQDNLPPHRNCTLTIEKEIIRNKIHLGSLSFVNKDFLEGILKEYGGYGREAGIGPDIAGGIWDTGGICDTFLEGILKEYGTRAESG